jgi:site-specific recombinase XerC
MSVEMLPVGQRILLDDCRRSLGLCLHDFLLDVQTSNCSPGTLRFYGQKLDAFLAYLRAYGATGPADLDAMRIRECLSEVARSHSAGGVFACFRAVRAFARFLLRGVGLSEDPLPGIRVPKANLEPLDPVAFEDVKAMRGVCQAGLSGARDRALLLVLFDIGLRAGELLTLNMADFDPEHGSLPVRKAKPRQSRTAFVARHGMIIRRRGLGWTAYAFARFTAEGCLALRTLR